MSDTKFTPGPWFCDYDGAIFDNNHKFIRMGSGGNKQLIANSHLIAASPELYEALQNAIELLASAEIQEAVRVRGMTKIIRDGDKALKKSRGES